MTGTEKCKGIMNEINKVIIGKEAIIKNVLAAIIAEGHVLLEDIPGVGKTTLAMTFSKAMSLKYSRMQFTPDVMPSDVTGFSIYNKETGGFEYKEGVIMSNFFLADEINRTSSKTQSALLEAMEEKKVTVDGNTYELKKPFIVMATQNPIGSIGTSMLPESQLDRFMMRLSMGYPDSLSEVRMLKSKEGNDDIISSVNSVVTMNEVIDIQNEVAEVYVHDDIYAYIVSIVNATRKNDNILLGVSPRGTIAIVNAAKAMAYICGRNYVIPDDVKEIINPVTNHRIILSGKARAAHVSVEQVIGNILGSVRIAAK
ncbi:MAG: MoxR family ATPase [Lachnospiraceae bacterium]